MSSILPHSKLVSHKKYKGSFNITATWIFASRLSSTTASSTINTIADSIYLKVLGANLGNVLLKKPRYDDEYDMLGEKYTPLALMYGLAATSATDDKK